MVGPQRGGGAGAREEEDGLAARLGAGEQGGRVRRPGEQGGGGGGEGGPRRAGPALRARPGRAPRRPTGQSSRSRSLGAVGGGAARAEGR